MPIRPSQRRKAHAERQRHGADRRRHQQRAEADELEAVDAVGDAAIVSVVAAPKHATTVKAAPTPLCETPLPARCSDPSVCIVVPTIASTISATIAESSQESRVTVRRLSRSGTCWCVVAPTSGSREATAASTSTTAPSPPIAAFWPTKCTSGPPKSGPAIAPIGRPELINAAVRPRRAGATLPIAQASAADQETALKTPAAKRRPTSSAKLPTKACSGAATANSSVAAIVTRRGPNLSARLPAGHRGEQHGRAVGADDDAGLRLAHVQRVLPARQQRRDREPEDEVEEDERADEHRQPAAHRSVALLRDPCDLAQGRRQSIGSAPCSASSALARENGREPKNPLCAESGLGWALSMHGCGVSMRLERAGVAAPEDRDERLVSQCQGADSLLGDCLPALAAVGAGAAGAYGQDAVEEEDALLRPGREVAVAGLRVAQVLAVLLEDVAEASGERAGRLGRR